MRSCWPHVAALLVWCLVQSYCYPQKLRSTHLAIGQRLPGKLTGQKSTPGPPKLLKAQSDTRLIPKILHQTYKSGNTTARMDELMRSWRVRNPGWEVRLYDDGACVSLVTEHFPEYLDTYFALKRNVERADFFRYMVILAHGGLYSDVDTESLIPLDSIIWSSDTMVAGWENEHSTVQSAMNAKFSRQRQALQWTLAARSGHAALRELCDRIVANAERDFHTNPNTATLLRTGPGVYTDVILKFALSRQRGHKDAVRILPKVSFGGMPRWQSGLNPEEEPGRAVVHYDQGSWKSGLPPTLNGAQPQEIMGAIDESDTFSESGQQRGIGGGSNAVDQSAKVLAYEGLPQGFSTAKDILFPVCMLHGAPLTLMLHLEGHGDEQTGFDVAAQLTTWGDWLLPGILPLQPRVADTLFQYWSTPQASGKIFLDIGAGVGFFSLTAASFGIPSLSFELANKSLASFRASVEYNSLHNRIQIIEAALGAEEEEICLDPLVRRSPSQLSVDIERGYGTPRLHAVTPICSRREVRRRASELVPENAAVGAVRISSSGWEGWILEGLQPVVRRWKPQAILIELYPELLESTGYTGRTAGIAQNLQALGYANATHMGQVCVRSRILAAQAQGRSLSQQEALIEPGWCKFETYDFSAAFEEEAPPFSMPELFLFSRSTESFRTAYL